MQYRNAHFDALEGKVKLDLPATHVGGGVWLGEGVEVHPSVNLASPVFLGSGVTIRRNASIGERTVIGADTLVDEFASISNSLIGSGSFVGRNTRITGCVIGSGCATTDSETIEYRALVSHVPGEPTPSEGSGAQNPLKRRAADERCREDSGLNGTEESGFIAKARKGGKNLPDNPVFREACSRNERTYRE